MKNILLSLALATSLLLGATSVTHAGYVRGYYKSNGTYVQPYYRSNPNGIRYDNYSYNGYGSGYNSSYYKYNTYNWQTPSYLTQDDYYTGYNYYRYNR